MKCYATASALAMFAMAGQAFADVTPQQVWDDFEAYMTNFGYAVTAREEMEGADLSVSDLTMIVTIPEEDGVVRVVMPDMTFVATDDGGVNVTYPEVSDITLFFVEREETVGEVVIEMTQSNFDMYVSGNPGDMTYDYSAESIALELVRVFGDGEEITRDMLSVSMSMGPVAGTSIVQIDGGMRSIQQEQSLGTLAIDLTANDPDSDEGGSFNMQLTGLTGSGATVLPQDFDVEDPMALFREGGSVDAVIKHSGGTTQFTFDEGDGPTAGQFSSTGGEIGVAVSNQSVTYAISATGQKVAVSGPELPLPVNAEMGEMGFALDMPISPSDEPQAAALSVVLGDFAVADMLWNILDPAQVLPRDPATIAFNIDAMATPFVSLFDPEAMETLGRTGGMPGELNSVTLSDLVVDVVGASLFGSGAFTFDNSDLETFDGLPRPMGELNLELAGAEALVKNLISMGLLSEQDAMGFNMGIAMLALPGDEPDTYVSTIEVNEAGNILANGAALPF